MARLFRLNHGMQTKDSESINHIQLTVIQLEDNGTELKTKIVRIPKVVFEALLTAYSAGALPITLETDKDGKLAK